MYDFAQLLEHHAAYGFRVTFARMRFLPDAAAFGAFDVASDCVPKAPIA
jgi:hypothetical protein